MVKSKSTRLGILLLSFSLVFLLNVLPMGLVVQATDPNLLGFWKFDEGSGTTAYDTSGNNNHGTLYGTLNWVTWVPGEIGSALSWPWASNARVEFPNLNLISSSAVTYSVWIKTRSNPGSEYMDVIYHGDKGQVEMKMRWDTTWHWYEILFGVTLQNTPPNTWYEATTGGVSPGTWHHLAGVWTKGGSVKLYVDGTKTGETNVPDEYLSGSPTGTFPGLIGAYYSGSNYEKGYEGLIDEVRIYNRALPDAEILLLKNEFTPPNLLGYWKFDEGSGVRACDSSGSDNDGTLNGNLNWVSGKSGSALSWPASSTAYVEFPNLDLISSNAVTYSVWVNAPSYPTREYMDVIYHGDKGQVEMKMRWDTTWHWYEILFGVKLQDPNPPPGGWYQATKGEVSSGVWHHLAGVWTKGGSVKLYVDGNKAETNVPDYYLSGSPTGTFPGLIGAYYSGSNYEKGYEGVIDQVRIYNRALPDAEILLLKNEFTTINAYCKAESKSVSVGVALDGSPSGFDTPHTFAGLIGSHSFSVPSTDANGHPFEKWSTGSTDLTLTVTPGGTYTAYYQTPSPVGGIAISIDRFALLAPFIGLSSILAIATAAAVIYVKRVKHRKEKQ